MLVLPTPLLLQNKLTQSVLAQCPSREAFKELFTAVFNYEKFGACCVVSCLTCARVAQSHECSARQLSSAPQNASRPRAGTPYRRGDRYYYSHNSGLQNQFVVRSSCFLRGGQSVAALFMPAALITPFQGSSDPQHAPIPRPSSRAPRTHRSCTARAAWRASRRCCWTPTRCRPTAPWRWAAR